MTSEKKIRTRRTFTVREKVRAVLSVWTERRTGMEICREMSVNWAVLDRWQNQAMEGMLSALEQKKEPTPALNGRLEKLMEKILSSQSENLLKLENRLNAVQKKRQKTQKQPK